MLSWIDDCASFGAKAEIERDRKEMFEFFDCDNVGDMFEYVGCKITRDENSITMTQPVLLQSFEDEFGCGKDEKEYRIPALQGSVLSKVSEEDECDPEQLRLYRKGIGKLLHMVRWSRPEMQNAVRDLSRHMQKCGVEHQMAMKRAMEYVVQSKEKGWTIRPTRKWDGKDKTFKFRVKGKSDSDYATCKETRRSVTGLIVWLEEALIMVKSMMQDVPSLSVTESELASATSCAQYLMYVKKYLESIGLEVELPMILEVDNKGAVDLINGYSTTGRTKHIDVRLYWLRDLKEKKIIKVVWCSGKDNEADLFTKNLGAVDFHKYADRLLRDISEVKKVRFSEEVEEISNVVSDEDDLEIREAVEMRFTDQSDQRKVRNSGLV
jgi:hypothetical protein